MPRSTRSQRGARPPPRALVVDDHPVNRLLLTHQLQSFGLEVQAAASGQEALHGWLGTGFDLVVTDCYMPDFDGFELSRALREAEARRGRPHTVIIGWTARMRGDEDERCRAAGMDGLLAKPASRAALAHLLSQWLPGATRAGDVGSKRADTPVEPELLGGVTKAPAEQDRLLADFQMYAQADWPALRMALRVLDLPTVARLTHRIKGAAQLIGALELAAVCEEIEAAAAHADAGAVAALRDRLTDALDRLERYVAGRATARGEESRRRGEP